MSRYKTVNADEHDFAEFEQLANPHGLLNTGLFSTMVNYFKLFPSKTTSVIATTNSIGVSGLSLSHYSKGVMTNIVDLISFTPGLGFIKGFVSGQDKSVKGTGWQPIGSVRAY